MKTVDITNKDCKHNITDLKTDDILITAVGKFVVVSSNDGKIVCKKRR